MPAVNGPTQQVAVLHTSARQNNEYEKEEELEWNGEITKVEEHSNREIFATITNTIDSPQPVTPDSDKEGSNVQKSSFAQPVEVTTVKDDEDDEGDAPDLIEEESQKRTRSSRGKRQSSKHYDDASSSDDDSYFATDLPAPNSSRLSFTSTGSVHATSSFYQNSARESDASLSFSDESEDDMAQGGGVHISPMLPPKGKLSDLNGYPKRIMRMHSVSSLASSTSEDETPKMTRSASAGSMSSYNSLEQQKIASGSKTPEPIQNMYPYLQSPSPGMIYPHAHPMMQEQMSAWMTASNPAGMSEQQPQNYGSTQLPFYGFFGIPYEQRGVYGMDDAQKLDFDSAEGPKVNQMVNGLPSVSGLTNRGTSGPGVHDDKSRQTRPIQSEDRGLYADDGKAAFAYNKKASEGSGDGMTSPSLTGRQEKGFKVYWQRWIMLLYMSILNLLSDWTCYSVAPIALLTEEAFGNIDPERLVVVFLGANAVASACEPIILARLGLRRTVLFGSLLLLIGSVVKSGGIPPIIPSDLTMGQDAWRVYLGFFLVGLSQPLYQCTPALLSASWFPEEERTMATGVALNANQLGIGFAFIFGTLLVNEPNDIPDYFGLLSLISTVVFLGTLIQFDDAPPTPPSASARVMRGTLEVNLPNLDDIVQSVRGFGGSERPDQANATDNAGMAPSPSPDDSHSDQHGESGKTRKRKGKSSKKKSGLFAPAPSPAMPGRVGQGDSPPTEQDDEPQPNNLLGENQGFQGGIPPQGMLPPFATFPPPQYQYPFWDPRMQQQHAAYQQQYYFYPQPHQAPPPFFYPSQYPSHLQGFGGEHVGLPGVDSMDEGAEPIVTITPHHLDIDIRDDQVFLSIRACLSRAGFIHALVAFTVSGIVINTLSTYMDYLVTLNGAPKYYTGIVGGTFQFVIMISSLIIGKQTDKTRAYYSVTVGMLVLGAFGLAECGVSLDEDNGRDLRVALVIVAALVGPLQPVSTELGVDVAYPLSENTVLVIQQLFSNLLSALFIPIFKALKDVGKGDIDERPEYTFSFYLLIVLHTAATVFFATFNGKYLRYEHELEKKEEEEREAMEASRAQYASHPFYTNQEDYYDNSYEDERSPLVS